MSIPLSYCDLVRAAKEGGEIADHFVEMLLDNVSSGHFSTIPCSHDPKCECSEEEFESLNEKFEDSLSQLDLN